jgi:hypothetical protein
MDGEGDGENDEHPGLLVERRRLDHKSEAVVVVLLLEP